jgi:hypothetical protein
VLSKFQNNGMIEEIIPLHRQTPSESIKEYFGQKQDLYFEFLTFFQRWLVVPAIIGSLTYILTKYYQESVQDSHFASFYALFMIFWSEIFWIFWSKREKEIAYENRCDSVYFKKTQEV